MESATESATRSGTKSGTEFGMRSGSKVDCWEKGLRARAGSVSNI
jgi:hypothetical protein